MRGWELSGPYWARKRGWWSNLVPVTDLINHTCSEASVTQEGPGWEGSRLGGHVEARRPFQHHGCLISLCTFTSCPLSHAFVLSQQMLSDLIRGVACQKRGWHPGLADIWLGLEQASCGTEPLDLGNRCCLQLDCVPAEVKCGTPCWFLRTAWCGENSARLGTGSVAVRRSEQRRRPTKR